MATGMAFEMGEVRHLPVHWQRRRNMNNSKKIEDPTEAALSAIQEALTLELENAQSEAEVGRPVLQRAAGAEDMMFPERPALQERPAPHGSTHLGPERGRTPPLGLPLHPAPRPPALQPGVVREVDDGRRAGQLTPAGPDPGDEVVYAWRSFEAYPSLPLVAGATGVQVPLTADSRHDLDAMADAITDRTRLLIVNTPHNPTGAVYPRELLEELVALCRSRGVLILSDEVYDHLVYEGEHVSLRSVAGAEDIALTVSSAGKAFAVTGWKVGWLTGPAELVGAARAVKQFLTYSSGPAFQRALGAYLPTDDAERHLAGQRERYRDARDRLVAGLREAGLDPVVPAAGYFVVVDLAPWGVTDAAEAAVRWTREAGVTGIPVGALCRPDGGHLRSWLRLSRAKPCPGARFAPAVAATWPAGPASRTATGGFRTPPPPCRAACWA